MDTSELFSQAVALEEEEPDKALRLYEQILDQENHAAAYINAGTICYNSRRFERAEAYYRKAIATDPSYALAYFDLANVLDESGRILDAIQTYLKAIKLAPGYADAHYNLALAYEKAHERGKALKHWRAYIKLDKTSPWSAHAKGQIARIVSAARLVLVRNTPKPRRTKRRGKLVLVHANQ